ncbi:hypothetical protein A3D78_05350 [Candidatus Gottesmanbacteria bacterium RIFCSPHIGHO2_02_FULL_39_14]|uniref:PIN domain-containing protein n=2 Tax=Candidatus Gottesmaniibacteriota TaxID=1752720 RepID=A0A1F6A0D8_9BACT|nr:MAG: hypothetical protein A3D78_05350 [Candidatus Gottesmanbacteria bacterium RIFCSPHIGHO2_02_FULL_39_14]OGG32057.1 MAG: hypothetical protein A3I51_00775 [Candidatus Gottesmanbacteria bacterium RIFCSPLOWO2_02_FULL_38_8]
MKEYILDTNCLLRYLLHDNIAQSNKVKKFFSQALSLKISIMIPIVVFTETVYAMVKLYKFERIIVADKLKTIVNNAYLEIERREILLQALTQFADSNFSLIDLLLYFEAKKTDKELLTFDRKLKKLNI